MKNSSSIHRSIISVPFLPSTHSFRGQSATNPTTVFSNVLATMGRRQRAARPSTPEPEEDEELDIDAFSQVLQPSGLSIRDVSNDGNCFFRAVSDQLYGAEDYHMKLRRQACDYLEQNKDHYQHFVDEERSFDQYVEEMRSDGVWADNLELQAISMVYSVNIRIHQSGKPSYDIRNHPDKNAQAIHLSYHFGEHYASVRPLHTADLQVPAQHDSLPLPRAPPSPLDHTEHNHEDRSVRRPRHGRSSELAASELDNVAAVWRRADRGYTDLHALVDKTRRTARNTASSDSLLHDDDRRNSAKNIEREMRDALGRLDSAGEDISRGKIVHRERKKKTVEERQKLQHGAASSADVDSEESQETYIDEDEEYERSVRRESDAIFAMFNEIEVSVAAALKAVQALSKDAVAEGSGGKSSRASKKREQEARKRERKERRRREQERNARDENDLTATKVPRPHELDIAI